MALHNKGIRGTMGNSETGQCANTSPSLRPLQPRLEGSGPMHIVPAADSTDPTPPSVHVDQMSRVDGCPDCVTNTEAPYRAEAAPRGFTAYYGCEACGYFWSTDWRD